jgi:hypothetical protein
MERFLNLIVTGPDRISFSYRGAGNESRQAGGVLAKRRRNGRDLGGARINSFSLLIAPIRAEA